MIRNTANQFANAQIVNASTGAAFVGTVTCYVTIDDGTQALGSTSSGVCTAKGNGMFQYAPTQAETNGALIAFTFIGTGAIPQTIEFPTITSAQAASLAVATSPTTPTVRDVILAALQDLNIAGDTPDPNDVNMAFARLNDFVDDLANDALLVYTITRTTWTLAASTASYTVGSTGTIAIDRPDSPNAIGNIGFLDTSATTPFERLLGPVLTEDEYAAISLKTLTSPYPNVFYYNPTNPLGVLKPFPIPTASSLQGVIYAPAAISEFGSLNDPIILPKGFRRFFRNQLVVEIASAFEKPAPQAAIQAARESKAKIKRTNTRMGDLAFPITLPGTGGGSLYDINSDGGG